MPVSILGQPYTPLIVPRDANGSLVTAGVAGTLSLYGPTSTTALTSGALTHFGNGAWGYTIAGSFLTAAGVYRFTVPTLTFGSTTLSNQGGEFSVGAALPWMQTFRDILVALTHALGDGDEGTTTALGVNAAGPPPTSTLADSQFAYGVANDWQGSQVVLLEPANVTDAQVLRVTAFAPATGTFTLVPQVTAIAAGTDYLVTNRNGIGWTYRAKRNAILAVLAQARPRMAVSDQVGLTSIWNTFEYAIPDTWVEVDAVYYRPTPSVYTGDWYDLAPLYWDVRGDRRLLVVNWPFGSNRYQLRVEGRIAAPLPAGLTSLVEAPADWTVAAAEQYLRSRRGDAVSRQIAREQYLDLVRRAPRDTAPANARMIA